MPVSFILLNTCPFDAGCLPPARRYIYSYYFCVFLAHACGVCSSTSAKQQGSSLKPAGQHIHVKLLMLQLSSTWLVGISLTYLFRFHAIDHGKVRSTAGCVFENQIHNTIAIHIIIRCHFYRKYLQCRHMTDVFKSTSSRESPF